MDARAAPGSDAQRAASGEGSLACQRRVLRLHLQRQGMRTRRLLQTQLLQIPRESAELELSNSLPRLLDRLRLWGARPGSCPVVPQTLGP